MAREITVYLCDIIDACDSIASILTDISIEAYAEIREKRSAVEREFIVIGEADTTLAKFWPERFKRLSDGRKAIGFRNILTHNYASVDHETVYETALEDDPRLRRECVELLRESEDVVKDGPWGNSGQQAGTEDPQPLLFGINYLRTDWAFMSLISPFWTLNPAHVGWCLPRMATPLPQSCLA
jgi:uncharacterized protein with HEPN domain